MRNLPGSTNIYFSHLHTAHMLSVMSILPEYSSRGRPSFKERPHIFFSILVFPLMLLPVKLLLSNSDCVTLQANCSRIFASVLADVSGGAATSITIIQEILIILGAEAPLHSPQMSSCSCSYTEVTASSCINFIFQRHEQIIISSGANNWLNTSSTWH